MIINSINQHTASGAKDRVKEEHLPSDREKEEFNSTLTFKMVNKALCMFVWTQIMYFLPFINITLDCFKYLVLYSIIFVTCRVHYAPGMVSFSSTGSTAALM